LINIQESFGEVRIETRFELNNEGISQLLDEEKAAYLIHVECGQTSFRNAYYSSSSLLEVAIPSDKLRGKIEIHSFIIAKERIEDYTNDKLNDWYADSLITLEKGNIL